MSNGINHPKKHTSYATNHTHRQTEHRDDSSGSTNVLNWESSCPKGTAIEHRRKIVSNWLSGNSHVLGIITKGKR